MQNIKLVAIDMDGTLLNNKKEMPASFVPWVKAHPEIAVVIASGRQYETLRRDFLDIEDSLYFMAENGGLLFHKGELLGAGEMNKDVAKAALKVVDAQDGLYPIICAAGSAYTRHAHKVVEENAEMYYKKLVYTDDLEKAVDDDKVVKLACFVEHKNSTDYYDVLDDIHKDIEVIYSGAEWIDLNNRGVSKGSAVKFLQEKLGIDYSECMAFGDYMNDFELIKSCGESYAMANGHPDLKAAAKHIAPSNEEEGVMQILEKLP